MNCTGIYVHAYKLSHMHVHDCILISRNCAKNCSKCRVNLYNYFFAASARILQIDFIVLLDWLWRYWFRNHFSENQGRKVNWRGDNFFFAIVIILSIFRNKMYLILLSNTYIAYTYLKGKQWYMSWRNYIKIICTYIL